MEFETDKALPKGHDMKLAGCIQIKLVLLESKLSGRVRVLRDFQRVHTMYPLYNRTLWKGFKRG